MNNTNISSDYTKPIEDWIAYADFMKSQINETLPEGNMPGILCKSRDFGKYDSEFNLVFELMQKGDRSDTLSYATIFKESDAAYFYDKIIDIDHPTMCLLVFRAEKKRASGYSKDPSTTLELTNNLIRGDYDAKIEEFSKIDFTSNSIYSKSYTQSNLLSILDPLLNEVMSHKNKVTYATVSITSDTLRHSVVYFFWYVEDNLHCGLYDPIFYDNKKSNYLFGITTLYIAMKAYSILKNIPITIQNISSLCYVDPKSGIRCAQYIMNASYCLIYSLYFIFCHLKNGSKCDADTLQRTINDTYVVEPSLLTRVQCRNNNEFRIVIFSFALTALAIMTNKKIPLIEIKK